MSERIAAAGSRAPGLFPGLREALSPVPRISHTGRAFFARKTREVGFDTRKEGKGRHMNSTQRAKKRSRRSAARASRRHLKGVAHLAAAGVLDGGDVAAVRAAVRANCSSTSHSAGLGRKLLSESGLDGAARAGLEFDPLCRTLVELALER